ncbi:MAG: TRAP transporter fused permease subunit [Roseibium album]|uniref:TRAP transporter, 4TM/12TM fusion protein n=1 Tax=Roseibium album TaxID=311410 RepID=A0A0M6ZNM3_9HYPH|nr:TRAP transporter fused permease subunit [Roseibium album]MBG6172825.1 TRAP transporter 4TM/12TM fusion protein [Labrenzia sp. EL_132]MBG6226956.1 TRAP transporter 4TM/12TM fusion protein [Labrenzia sp. EL_208]MCR9056884.1 TRAP transporter fused permease subunit [Paracoccaceae bacterium]CTQ59014.1 TRAP transporter, 4TM/12TM fusion protein [Roseibium album]CTQ63947.1 TRAP transporter, 4TM/12TM fusion protein [Roseibium album]
MQEREPGTSLLDKRTAILVAAFCLGLFHLAAVSGVISISTMPLRLVHVAMAFSLLFALKPASKRLAGTKTDLALTGVLILAILGASLWLISRWKSIAFSGGLTTDGDYYAGLVILILVFEAARRGIGLILAIITLVFFCYPFISPYLPGILNGRGYSLERMVLFLTTDTQGVYGIPIGVAATYIIVFTIFGAMLSRFGAGDFFFEISIRLTRGLRAASAKSAVLFSTLIGMVSGSAAGNVAVTGTVTIPIMKREGYQPHQAGAIEAVASTGGQLMPPVMGAAAFIMAEIVGVPYTTVMAVAILPALLFFGSAFFVVHLQAVKSGIEPRADDQSDGRPLSRVLIQGAPFIGAFAVLLALMLSGFSPFKASLWGMAALIGLDIVRSRRIDLDLIRKIAGSIAEGSRNVITISAACAAAGVISGTLGITGLGSKIALLIDVASNGQLILALLFTMVASIILGMGLPTTAAYLILATVVAPALVKFGVPMLTAHFFVFYYGCISTITPPVALASYVAGGIAGADVNKVGWTAASYATTSFVLPFAFVFGPGLLMQGDVFGNLLAVITGFAGVGAVAAGVVGCLFSPLSAANRAVALGAGLCLLAQFWPTALVGAVLLGWLFIQQRAARQVSLKS